MIPEAVHRSPGICLTTEESPGKHQPADRQWRKCDQSSSQMGCLTSKWRRQVRKVRQEGIRKERRKRWGWYVSGLPSPFKSSEINEQKYVLTEDRSHSKTLHHSAEIHGRQDYLLISLLYCLEYLMAHGGELITVDAEVATNRVALVVSITERVRPPL